MFAEFDCHCVGVYPRAYGSLSLRLDMGSTVGWLTGWMGGWLDYYYYLFATLSFCCILLHCIADCMSSGFYSVPNMSNLPLGVDGVFLVPDVIAMVSFFSSATLCATFSFALLHAPIV